MKKKRSRFLSEKELNLLDVQTHNYVETWSEAMLMFQKDGEPSKQFLSVSEIYKM